MSHKSKKPSNPLNSYVKYSGIAIQMIVIIVLGSYGGLKLDEAYPNEYHAYTLICSLAAVAIAIYIVIRQVSNVSKDNKSLDE